MNGLALYVVLYAELTFWSIFFVAVAPINFAAKWHVGQIRPEVRYVDSHPVQLQGEV